MKNAAFVASIGGILALATACDDHAKDTKPAPVTTAATASAAVTPMATAEAPSGDNAEQLYALRCAMCHGATGKGDGQMSKMLTPPPRDYSDPAWQASVTDERIRTVILGGGAAVGKSAVMPANADLASQPDLLKGLVALIRSWAPKK